MSASYRDIYAKSTEYEKKYPYKSDGLHALMSDYWRLKESSYTDSDMDAAAILCDLERALDHCNLTPRMRQVITLKYFVEFTEVQISKILGVNQSTVSRTASNALDRLEAFMAYGYKQKEDARIDAKLTETHPFITWLNEVTAGLRSIYSRPQYVTEYLADFFEDKRAIETLRQRREGFIFKEDYTGKVEYPYYSDAQLRWKDRRMSFVPEVFPVGDVAGTRKVITKLRDDPYGREYAIEKRKIFVGRCF